MARSAFLEHTATASHHFAKSAVTCQPLAANLPVFRHYHPSFVLLCVVIHRMTLNVSNGASDFILPMWFIVSECDSMTSPPTIPSTASSTPLPKRPRLDVAVSVKLTAAEKRALDQLAFDTDDTLARLIRSAIRRTYPDLLGNGER